MKFNKITCTVLFYLMAASIFAGGSSDKKTKTEKQPEWIINSSQLYSDDTYITGVGSAKTRKDAENDAVASIGKVLNQNIESEEKTQQSFSTTTSEISTYLSNVKTSTSITDLAGVSIKENWTAGDGTEYALAVLNRNESGQYYRNKIDENSKAIEDLLQIASKTEGTFSSCSNAVKAYELAKENEYYHSLLTIIKPIYSKTTLMNYGNSYLIAQRVSELVSKVNVLISVEGDTNGRISNSFSKSLSTIGIHSFGGTSGNENLQYTLLATVSYEPVQMADSKYSFVRYNILTELIDNSTGKNVLPWTSNARIGKLSQAEAEQAAIRALETKIQEEYPIALKAIF